MTTEQALAIAHARAGVCDPRGSHRPIQTATKLVDGQRYRFRFCGDCRSWVNPTQVNAQEKYS